MKPNKISARKRRSFRREPSHDPEVDGDKAPGIVDEQISGMHVGVKKTVAQRMAQESLDHGASEMLEIEVLGLEPRTIRERRGLDPFEREDVARGALPVHLRDPEIRVVAGILRHLREGGGFEPQIHLERDRAPQGVDHFNEAQPTRFGGHPLRIAGGKREGVEIGRKSPLDARPQHLHRHGAASELAVHFGAMHLRDGGGRDRAARTIANNSLNGLPSAASMPRTAASRGNGAILSCNDSEIARDRRARPRRGASPGTARA